MMRPEVLDAAAGVLVSRLVDFRGEEAGGYTSRMDRVRFGRALGFGARQAVKTLVTAVDAATAENPTAKSPARTPAPMQTPGRSVTGSTGSAAAANSGAGTNAARTASRTVAQAREVQQGVRRGTKRFGEAVWNPFVRLSGVLWLEVTGVFFGIFALFAAGTVWKLRGEWHSPANYRGLWGAVAMLVVFGYFCVSSFVRARRRERER
jgi:hypothetical protein